MELPTSSDLRGLCMVVDRGWSEEVGYDSHYHLSQ